MKNMSKRMKRHLEKTDNTTATATQKETPRTNSLVDPNFDCRPHVASRAEAQRAIVPYPALLWVLSFPVANIPAVSILMDTAKRRP